MKNLAIKGENIIWRADLSSAAAVTRQHGTIHGSPTFGSDGVTLNGTTDYLEYAIPSGIFSPKEISFVIEFTPNFAHDDGLSHFLFRANTSDPFYICKHSVNMVYLARNGYYPFDGAAYWNEYSRNVLLFSVNATNGESYLNGANVDSFSPATIDITDCSAVYLGSSSGGASKFDGVIHSFSIYNQYLNQQDAESFTNRSTFTSENTADVWLDFDNQYGTGVVGDEFKTKDKSRYGRDATLGDGTANYPDFLAPGFDLDGASEYIKIENASGIYNNDEQTIIICFSPDFEADENVVPVIFSAEPVSSSRYGILKGGLASNYEFHLYMGGTLVEEIPFTAYGDYWRSKQKNVMIVSGESGNTSVWLNGVVILDSDATAWSACEVTDIHIGQYGGGGYWFNGKIHFFATLPIMLGDIQVQRITKKLLAGETL